jgi:hypothetical protein
MKLSDLPSSYTFPSGSFGESLLHEKKNRIEQEQKKRETSSSSSTSIVHFLRPPALLSHQWTWGNSSTYGTKRNSSCVTCRSSLGMFNPLQTDNEQLLSAVKIHLTDCNLPLSPWEDCQLCKYCWSVYNAHLDKPLALVLCRWRDAWEVTVQDLWSEPRAQEEEEEVSDGDSTVSMNPADWVPVYTPSSPASLSSSLSSPPSFPIRMNRRETRYRAQKKKQLYEFLVNTLKEKNIEKMNLMMEIYGREE